jgi:hypothetical protein
MWKHNCFITLTYDDENLPSHGTLVKKHFQDFMKRLRKKYKGIEYDQHGKKPIRFFHCGEYGDKYNRPHYHALLFNFDFPDKTSWVVRNGNRTFRSLSLNRIWGKGLVEIGSANWKSAAYVARYIVKKINGDESEAHYKALNVNIQTGAIQAPDGQITQASILPEYTTMSSKNGIGYDWYKKYGDSNLWATGTCVVLNTEGKSFECRIPRYYVEQLKLDNPEKYEIFKAKQLEKAQLNSIDNSPERLEQKRQVKERSLQRLLRKIDHD